MTSITPYVWFDSQAEEAMACYTSLFPDSRIRHIEHYPDESLDPHFVGMAGKVIHGDFELFGQPFQCLDGGPTFPITPAISLYTTFDDRTALEAIWRELSAGGTALMELGEYPWSQAYGWVRDRFGLTWQLAYTDELGSQRITPFLMFTGAAAGRAQQALADYTALFAESAIDEVARYAEGDLDVPGSLKLGRFHLGQNHFMAMDSTAGHDFGFSEGLSLFVSCRDQDEIDRYWAALTSNGGSESQCGWCKDSYGVSWQIVPSNLGELLSAGPAAVQAMMQMRKIDVELLERAGAEA